MGERKNASWCNASRSGIMNAPVAAVHALAYPLGGQFHIPHGLSNSGAAARAEL